MVRFSKYLWLYFLLSALILVPGVFSLIRYGLRPSIDFTGGTLVELAVSSSVTSDTLTRMAQSGNVPLSSIEKSASNTYVLRIRPVGDATIRRYLLGVTAIATPAATVLRNETVGPVLGRELLVKAVVAAIIAMLAILGYVAYAFKNVKFGVSAVLALFHDLLVVLGAFSLFGKYFRIEVDTLFVTAFLTTMSFSVHDTIVVFDRIRELLKKGEKLPFDALCDKAMTETIGRSLANSFTIIFMLLALVLMGGETVRWFVVALLIGTISGTYSSPFVATPILILWDRWEKKRVKSSF